MKYTTCTQQKELGLTLVELMISMALGLLVILIATTLLLSSKTAYATQDEATRLQDTGRYALESIARAVRQSSYENWDREDAPIIASLALSANISGLDAASLKQSSYGIESPLTASVNGSDVLALRFFGSGSGERGDGTMTNCAGFSVPAATSQDEAEEQRGWSIFYLAQTNGEPELRCKYQGKDRSKWDSDAIATGVESFQVLYGIDTDGDSLPNQYLTASAVNALDNALVLDGANAEERAKDVNKKTYWKKIVALKISLLVRGAQATRADALSTQYDLFGKEYSDKQGDKDIGTRINEAKMPVASRNRLRKMFTVTITLRNQSAGSRA